jgi:hypothetical protein
MKSVVVAFESESNRKKISEMLEAAGIQVRYRCKGGAEVIRAIKNMGGGLVVCGYKLADITASDLAYDLAEIASVLMIARASRLDMCDNEYIFKLPSPVNGSELIGSVRMLLQMENRRTKSVPSERDPEEEKLIQIAKQLLMDKNRMTEDEAHRFIQQRSMNTSQKMVETAKLIIRSYEVDCMY